MTLASTPAAHDPDLHFATLDTGRRVSPQSIAIAVLANAAILLLLLLVRTHPELLPVPTAPAFLTAPLELPPVQPPALTDGGSGGATGATPISKGNPPPPSPEQLSAPRIAVDDAKLANVPSIEANLNMAKIDILNIGMPNAPNVGASLGHGDNGIGFGGTGSGPGSGPGRDGGFGDRPGRPGGSISKPEVLYAPEPQFSEEARRAKVGGNVLLYLVVDANGRPTHVRVLRGLGLGLDEKAMEAVLQYKFKPALQNGHPVPVEMNVDVNFQIF